ncbi:YktB family protein [Alicyclobacillus fodiniaquatilis]|jgi:uncharacterized protein YktB (UPF0637 family)|uniref:UPF0637 protein ACFSB2_26375 n=2 Tax=Bacillati TaxID=1783272 RepID=A0ABW4JRK3_9BACL
MFSGFLDEDFDVFAIAGLDARMDAIKSRVRPKLEALGAHFQTYLSLRLGEDVYAHVAKHARRTVNPPDDTWVAFSTNQRGYKQHPHFQIGLWQTHLFVTFGYIYEATAKAAFGAKLFAQAEQVLAALPQDFVLIPDHMSPDVVPLKNMDVSELQRYAKRLQEVKKAELLLGVKWPRDEVTSWTGAQFISQAESAMDELVMLYRLD